MDSVPVQMLATPPAPRQRLVDRWYLKDSLRRELRRAKESNTPLTVTVLALDRGHRVTEATVRELGHIICAHMRKTDMTCRYADREFVLVAPELSADATDERVHEIRRAARTLEPRQQLRRLLPPTIYAGVASAGRDGWSARHLIDTALHAVLQARLLYHHQRNPLAAVR